MTMVVVIGKLAGVARLGAAKFSSMVSSNSSIRSFRSPVSLLSPTTKSSGLARFSSVADVAVVEGHGLNITPPDEITKEIAAGVQATTMMYIESGAGGQRLRAISADPDISLVTKWQRMMEAYLGTQVHVLTGFGYAPNEKGLALYNQQLGMFIQSSSPEDQEEVRVISRDTWRKVLSTTFHMDLDDFQELSIVDARNIMHQVSQKMQSEDVLKEISDLSAAFGEGK